MERMQGLARMWAWLPTFRAVAEEEHVSRAAKRLNVSPSAVSRMVGLLEEDVGQPLFSRVGRSIQLNAAGEHLLAGVRGAMRMVDDSLALVTGSQFVGPVRIACAEPVTRAFLLPALAELGERFPAMIPEVGGRRAADVDGLLLRGQLDVALLSQPVPHSQLSLARLGELKGGVYAGAGHPLRGARRIKLADIVEHPFVMVAQGLSDSPDPWPLAHERKVALSVDTVDLAAELCAAGKLLACLPDVVAAHYRKRWGADLLRLPLDVVRPIEVFALWRRRLDQPGRAEVVVEAVRDQLLRSH